MDYLNLYKPQTHFAVVKTDTPNFFEPYTRVLVQTDSLNFEKPPTHFAKVETDSPNFYLLPTSFAEVKTNYGNFYMPVTRLHSPI